MDFALIYQKLDFLSGKVPESHLLVAKTAFRQAVKPILAASRLAPGHVSGLELDLLYAIFRQRAWLHLPVFQDVLTDFVHLEFGLPHVDAESLTFSVAHAVLNLAEANVCPLTDDDFLRYAFVMTASAIDETRLVADMGIGKTLIGRLKKVAESLLEGGDSNPTFVPEIDATFSRIMIELAREMKRVPWVLDHYRLYYHLLVRQGDTLPDFSFSVAKSLFEVALSLGQKRRMTEDAIRQRWDGAPEVNIIQVLQKADVIFCCDKASDGRASTYSLTTLGYEITASAFVQRKLARTRDPLRALKAAKDIYQIAAIRFIGDPTVAAALVLDKAIAPDTFKACISVIAKCDSIDKALTIINQTLDDRSRPLLRRAAIELLPALKIAPPLWDAKLSEIAKSDESPRGTWRRS